MKTLISFFLLLIFCFSSFSQDKVGNVYITGKSGVTGLYWNFATLKYNPS